MLPNDDGGGGKEVCEGDAFITPSSAVVPETAEVVFRRWRRRRSKREQ